MNTKKVFLASSAELKEDREQFEIFINRKNKDWANQGIFIELVVWEDFLDAISQSRLQDEYNRAIRDCDVFVMLFWTKVGRFTDEEFDAAFQEFKATNKPLIFTYFKDAELSIARANKKDLMSLWAFQEKLDSIGHFYTVYKNTDQLTSKFNQQLDKLASYLGSREPFARGGRANLGTARSSQARTKAFTDEYLYSETGPVPFGGRDNELRVLDEWIADPHGPPRMLITAPAGRGKSALLVRWMKNLQDRGVCGADGWRLVFIPISIRTGTNRPEVFYEDLARRLSDLTAEPLENEAFRDSHGLRGAVRDQLDQLASKHELKTLIVIDGVDEALEGSFDPTVLPTPLPNNIRILLSARWQVGDESSRGWLERLGWDRSVKVAAFELDKLHAAQIAEVLIKLGAPLDVLTQQPGLVKRLAELTEGEPLLVRYYAEDLWTQSSKGARIGPTDLGLLKPGFDSYFKRWFELQERLWKDEGNRFDLVQVDAVLSVLAFALGPLPQADLLLLMEHIHGVRGLATVDRLLEPLRRWVFGGGQSHVGYVLTHPKVGEYLQRNRFPTSAVRIKQGFADWGRTHCIALNSGRINPEQASPYCLQFLPKHLTQADSRPEDFMCMVENGWRGAWEHLEGGPRGFSSAVQEAMASQLDNRSEDHLGEAWRCCLALSSIKSFGVFVPTELVFVAAEKSVISIRQAAHFAYLKTPSNESVKLLGRLARCAGVSPSLATELISSALTAAKAIAREDERSIAVAWLAADLEAEQLDEALSAAAAMSSEVDRSRLLVALAPHLSGQQLSRALASAKSIRHEDGRTKALVALAGKLTPSERSEAVTSAASVQDEVCRSTALVALAPHLDLRLRNEVIKAALSDAKVINNDHDRSRVVAVLAPHLTSSQLDELLNDIEEELLNAIGAGGRKKSSKTMAALLPCLVPAQKNKILRKVLAPAIGIAGELDRLEALAEIAIHLDADQLTEAYIATQRLPYTPNLSQVLEKLAARLAVERPDEALVISKAIRNESERSKVLITLAPHLGPNQFGKALQMAAEIANEGCRSEIIIALAPVLTSEFLNQSVMAAKKIRREPSRSLALAVLAPYLERQEGEAVLRKAFASAKSIDDKTTVLILNAAAPRLTPELLGLALSNAKEINNEYDRSLALAELTQYLGPQQRSEALREALLAAKAIRDQGNRSQVLTTLATNLSPEQLDEALLMSTAINDEASRSIALGTLGAYLDQDQNCEVFNEAFILANSGSEDDGSNALASLASNLTAEQVGEVIDRAKRFRSERNLARVLVALAPRLSQQQMSDTLVAIKSINHEYYRSDILAALAPHLGPSQVSEALAIANSNFRALAALIPCLSPAQLIDLLTAAKTINDEADRARALTALASRLPEEQLEQALDAAKCISDKVYRSMAVSAFSNRLVFSEAKTQAPGQFYFDRDGGQTDEYVVRDLSIRHNVKDLIQLIRAAQSDSRQAALSTLQTTVGATMKIGGQKAVFTICNAIIDVGRWYP
jgi:hypothetical protein